MFILKPLKKKFDIHFCDFLKKDKLQRIMPEKTGLNIY